MQPLPRVALAVVLAVALLGCDRPEWRFVGWVLRPDRVERLGLQELDVPGLDRPVTIWFDQHAVPHVDAPDERALSLAIGFLHGRDRRFQLESLRLAAAGRLRELAGDRDTTGVLSSLEVFGRAVGFAQRGRDYLVAAPDADREALEAYAAGINAATTLSPPPLELRLLGHTPAPWTAHDTAMVMSMVSFGLCQNWRIELGRLELLCHQLRSGGSVARALAVWPPRFALPPHLIGEAPATDPFAGIPVLAPELVEYLRAWAEAKGPVAPGEGPDVKAPALGSGGDRSNNWAMSGAWTGTGKAALGADPHMLHALPPLGYLMHVRCADSPAGPYEVVGGGFVGLPSLPFATNGRVAWGVTANWADVTDLFVEQLAEGKPDHYLYAGEARPFEVREEVFRIRRDDGSFRTATRRIRSTVHGVLVNDFDDRLPSGFPLVALRWSSGQGGVGALRQLYRARDVGEAQRALRGFDVLVGHFALADDGGSIGYAGTMRLPRRTRHLGTLPVPGWTGTYDWRGHVPPDELPTLRDPDAGFLATANNQVVQPESVPYPLNFDGDVRYRFARILQRLGAGRGAAGPVAATAALQFDGVALDHADTRAVVAPAVEALLTDADPVVAAAAAAYLGWDGEVRPGAAGPSVSQSLSAHLLQRLLEDEMTPATVSFVLTYYNIEPLVAALLTDAGNPAWDDRRTARVESAGEVAAAVFRETVAALRARYGDDVATWSWTRVAPFVLRHPFGVSKALGPVLNRGPLPTRGTGNTVFKHQSVRAGMTAFPVQIGPVLRINVDLADLGGSRMVLPGGQSGRPASPHYDDLLPLYLEGGGVSMRMGFDGIEGRSVGRLVLR